MTDELWLLLAVPVGFSAGCGIMFAARWWRLRQLKTLVRLIVESDR